MMTVFDWKSLEHFYAAPKNWEERQEQMKKLRELRKEWKKSLGLPLRSDVKTLARCRSRFSGCYQIKKIYT